MPNQNTSQKSSNKSDTKPSNTSGPKSKYQIVKDYGGRTNFQASFGLKMTPEDLEEGNHILESFQAQDAEDAKSRK